MAFPFVFFMKRLPRASRNIGLFFALITFVPGAFAAVADADADTQWQALEADRRAIASGATTSAADDLVALANRLRDFRVQNERHPAAVEAKQKEAAALVEAAFLGERAQDARIKQLVSEVRTDERIDPAVRLELAAGADNLAVERRGDLSAEARLDEFERVARALQVEFPEVRESYASLLAIARSLPDAKGAALARELTEMPDVPGDVSLAATDHISRCALVGRRYLDVVAARDPDGLVDLDAAVGKPVVFYTWASDHAYSQWLAGEIARTVGKEVVVVGLKLNGSPPGDAVESRSTTLPGIQFDASTEAGGLLRWSLRLNEPGLVYLADDQGMILTVSAQNDLNAQLGALAAR